MNCDFAILGIVLPSGSVLPASSASYTPEGPAFLTTAFLWRSSVKKKNLREQHEKGVSAIPSKFEEPLGTNLLRLFVARSLCANRFSLSKGPSHVSSPLYSTKPSINTSSALCADGSPFCRSNLFLFGRPGPWRPHRELSRVVLHATTLKGISTVCPVITSRARIFQRPVGSLKAMGMLSRNGVE